MRRATTETLLGQAVDAHSRWEYVVKRTISACVHGAVCKMQCVLVLMCVGELKGIIWGD